MTLLSLSCGDKDLEGAYYGMNPYQDVIKLSRDNLDKDIAKIIIAEKQNANLFEKMISESTVKPKFIAAWLVGDIFAFIKENNCFGKIKNGNNNYH